MATAGGRGKLFIPAKEKRHVGGWKFQAELVRPLRSWRKRLGVGRRYLQRRRHFSDRPRLGSAPRRFVGDDEQVGNAILVSKRGRSQRARRHLRLSLRARARDKREQIIHFVSSASRNRSRNGICAELILWRATSSAKNSARSTSGNSLNFPERGGNSISKV